MNRWLSFLTVVMIATALSHAGGVESRHENLPGKVEIYTKGEVECVVLIIGDFSHTNDPDVAVQIGAGYVNLDATNCHTIHVVETELPSARFFKPADSVHYHLHLPQGWLLEYHRSWKDSTGEGSGG